MTLTPQITLSINLLDYSGNQIGSNIAPAYVRIALCNYGPFLPAIPGTGLTGKVATWPGDIPYVGATITVKLWGNDVIVPSNTYYMVSLLDANKNVIQSAAYQFTGVGTIDLSSAVPIISPVFGPPLPQTLITIPYSANPVIDLSLGSSFQITLTGPATITTINGYPGQPFRLLVRQDPTGNHVLTFGANIKGGVPNGLVASLATLFAFMFDGLFSYTSGIADQ